MKKQPGLDWWIFCMLMLLITDSQLVKIHQNQHGILPKYHQLFLFLRYFDATKKKRILKKKNKNLTPTEIFQFEGSDCCLYSKVSVLPIFSELGSDPESIKGSNPNI